MTDYTDARKLHPDYEQRICPECGTTEWFKHLEKDRWATDQWNCQTCGSYYEDVLEYPCPACDIRMVRDGNYFECQDSGCEFDAVKIDVEKLLKRLSSDSYPDLAHKPGVLMGECPLCGTKDSVNGGPDGELECDECENFYAGQYQDSWYCYAIWMDNRNEIRVNKP